MKKILLSLVTLFAVGAMTAGASQAVFSASADIPNNVVTAGTVTLVAHNFTENKPIGKIPSSLTPGAWTPEGRAELYNTGTVPVHLYMYVDNVTGDACAKTNLAVYTGYAGGDEHARTVLYNSLTNLTGSANRVQVTGNPPFATLGPNITQVIWQKAQLDSSANDWYQGKGCQWTEYFVAESL